MKIPGIAHAIGHIDAELVASAVKSKKKTKCNPWFKRGPIAACFAVLVIVGAAILPSLFNGNESISGKYKYQISTSEIDIEWPWEYKTNGEKFQTIRFNGKDYHIKYLNPIGTELLGDILDTCEAEGVDSYSNEKHIEIFDIRKINCVSEEKLVAAGNDTGFYVYMSDDTTMPATFGEVLDLYGLTQNLEFNDFTVCEGYDEKGYFSVNDDAYIWNILSSCRDAKVHDETDSFDMGSRNYLAFTATSDALGGYESVVYISEDGYFATNIFNYNYVYFIGKEVTGKIIRYARNNSTESQFSPYALTIAGTLTEIGDGYVLIDDTILCANAENGTVYKVYTNDIRVKRCIECLNIEVGNTVAVKYDGTISENNEVSGAYSMYPGTLVDKNLAIPE